MFRSTVEWSVRILAIAAMVLGTSTVRSDEDRPEDVVKNRGLKRSGSTYILAAELDVQKKLNEARTRFQQMNFALMQRDAFDQGIEDQKAMVRELQQQQILLNQQLQQNLPAVQHNQLVAAVNEITGRLNLLRAEAADPNVKQQMDKEVPQRRAAFIQAVLELRQLVDSTAKQYAELAGDDTIKKALSDLGAKSKSTFKLGPSRDFQEKVKLLEKIEKSVLTEEVELRRRGGVFEVDVTFNKNETVSMIFDTGASFVTLSSEVARRIGLTPQATDRPIELHVADGSVVQARQMTIPSVRVGKFTLNNVVCAVMPADKKDAPLLLGQSFINQFTHRVEGERLIMTKVESEAPAAKTAPSKKNAKSKRPTKAATGRNAAAVRGDSEN
jgi:clan AA aspartic protease (TIGR02281 family)